MDELKALMGDAYQDGISVEEISNFFKGKKFADLSTGNYVDKNKYESEVKNLNSQLQAKNQELDAKLTDDEKIKKSQADKDAEIENLKKLLAQNTLTTNKANVNSILSESRNILSIKEEDDNFTSFVENITTEDNDKSTNVAKYISKIVKDAYEKGKKDATKNSMGNFGKSKNNNGGSDTNEIDNLGKRIASQNVVKNKFDYFAKK